MLGSDKPSKQSVHELKFRSLGNSNFLFFIFRFRPKMCGLFYFLLFFGPKMKLFFLALFIIRPKKENPFTVGL